MKRRTACIFLFASLFFARAAGWTETLLTGQDLDLQLQPGDQITSVTVSEDNTLLAVGLYNPSRGEQNIGPLVYDLQQKKELVRLYETNDNSPITVITLSADNRYLFTGDHGGHGAIRRCSTGVILHRIDSPKPVFTDLVFPQFVGGSFASDNARLVTADVRGFVQLWNVETGEEIKRVQKPEWTLISGVEVFADGVTFLVSVMTSGAYIDSFEDDSKSIPLSGWPQAKIHRNGQWVMSMNTDPNSSAVRLTFWDQDGNPVNSFGDFPLLFQKFDIQPGGLLVAEMDTDQRGYTNQDVHILDPQNQGQSGKLEDTAQALSSCVRFFGEEKIMVATKENQIKIFDLEQLVTGIERADLYEN